MADEYAAKGAKVIGKSARTHREKQLKFDDKYGLGFTLLADTEHTVADKFGVWGEKTNYGKKYMGIQPLRVRDRPEGQDRSGLPESPAEKTRRPRVEGAGRTRGLKLSPRGEGKGRPRVRAGCGGVRAGDAGNVTVACVIGREVHGSVAPPDARSTLVSHGLTRVDRTPGPVAESARDPDLSGGRVTGAWTS